MVDALQVFTVLLVAVAMGLSLAHALELPGKRRLSKEVYGAVQRIYYPGFTIGGISEPVSLLLTLVLLSFTPWGSLDFWLTLLALLGLIGMQAVYWLVTHPVNKVWLEGEALSRAGSGFFSSGLTRSGDDPRPPEWTALRDRWEYSHVGRAALALISFVAFTIAISGGR